MEQKVGVKASQSVATIPKQGQLTKGEAMSLLRLCYPKAPDEEIVRCAILCRDFGLHPLMKEVHLVPFNEGKPNETWVTVMGINATRKLMAQRGAYSYIDDTPRIMSNEEQKRRFGKVDEHNIVAITKLKNTAGMEAPGYGRWPKGKQPYGTDKGNSQENMAIIRSERNAFGRLCPDVLPQDVEVSDEAYTEVPDVKVLNKVSGEMPMTDEEKAEATPKIEEVVPAPEENIEVGHWCHIHNCEFKPKNGRFGPFYSHEIEGMTGKDKWCKEPKDNPPKPDTEETPPPAEPDVAPEDANQAVEPPEKPTRDVESLKTWSDLYKACFQDFVGENGKPMQPQEVMKELNVSQPSELGDTPAECYLKIAAVRKEY